MSRNCNFKLISHRGNIFGKNETTENHPDYIQKALDLGYDVEIDLWCVRDDWYLGHDGPQYSCLDIKRYLKDSRVWIHCKNIEALIGIVQWNKFVNANYFFHVTDPVTLTSYNWIWAFPGTKVDSPKSICVMPEYVGWNKTNIDNIGFGGVCSDIIGEF